MKISDADQTLVTEAKAKLLEHFDSVLILVTRHDGGEQVTASFESGGGNFYAQMGHVREWLSIQDQYQREHAKRKDQEEQG